MIRRPQILALLMALVVSLFVLSVPGLAFSSTSSCFESDTGTPVSQKVIVTRTAGTDGWLKVTLTVLGRMTRISDVAQNEELSNESGDAEYTSAVATPSLNVYAPEGSERVYVIVAVFLTSPYNNDDAIGCIITVAVGAEEQVSQPPVGTVLFDSISGHRVLLGPTGF